MLYKTPINHTIRKSGKLLSIDLSYELFGQPIGDAPVVVVNHALTGNSHVAGENGWWQTLIGENTVIDLNHYTVIAFNAPGNGYDDLIIPLDTKVSLHDVASIFIKGLENLGIHHVYAIIGGSLGGAIAWEMAYQQPDLADHLIPIATDFQASDWLIAHCHIQELILNHSTLPLEHARQHAMLLYRTPQSINERFKNQKEEDSVDYKIACWLNYHGDALQKRFSKEAYQLLNNLLATIWVCDQPQDLQKINSNIHIISIDTDLYFTHQRAEYIYEQLQPVKNEVDLHTIISIHGHDAFLMEYDQLNSLLAPIFKK